MDEEEEEWEVLPMRGEEQSNESCTNVMKKEEREYIQERIVERETVTNHNKEYPDFQGDFEYCDHTADVQIHAWGKGIKEAFETAGKALVNVATNLNGVEERDNIGEETVQEQILYTFSAEGTIYRDIVISSICRDPFKLTFSGKGEVFDMRRHTQETEVKAITYSNMQIHEDERECHVYFIVDI